MKRLITMVCCLLLAVGDYAQQALGQRPNVKSPIINKDGSVTLQLLRSLCSEGEGGRATSRKSSGGDAAHDEAGQWHLDGNNEAAQPRALFLQLFS